jgi:hypothetical protein
MRGHRKVQGRNNCGQSSSAGVVVETSFSLTGFVRIGRSWKFLHTKRPEGSNEHLVSFWAKMFLWDFD